MREMEASVYLCDKELLRLMEDDSTFIQPFSRKRLQSASYDVSLSNEVFILKPSAVAIDISAQDVIDNIYEAKDISAGYVIKPGEFILCTIQESVALPDDIVAFVEPRTRLTRLGLLLSRQFCNPSYKGTLRLGLKNMSGSNISLVPGLAIGQLVFSRLKERPLEENLYRNKPNAAYQQESSFRGSTFEDEELSPEALEILNGMFRHLGGSQYVRNA